MVKTKPSKSQPCPLPSALTIHLVDSDIVDYNKVDDRGYIRPNKRAWIGLDVTVLLGHHTVKDGAIFVSAGTQKFMCQILNNTYVSSISSEYAGKEVTLIIQYFTNWIDKSFSFIPISKYFSVKCLKS